MNKNHTGFTMIELLFVIVIMGIVGGLALEAIRQYYNGIYRTSEYTKRVADADHILEQVSKYFENGLYDSLVILDKDANPTGTNGCEANFDNSDGTVAFVAVDFDGLQGYWNGNRWSPTWNSYARINTNSNIVTINDANYTAANAMAGLLDNNATVFDKDMNNTNPINKDQCDFYNWEASTILKYNKITAYTDKTLSLANRLNSPTGTISDLYLLRTGYAFRAYNGEFRFYSNFKPWKAENYATTYQLMGEKVAHFRIDNNASSTISNSKNGAVITLKICMFGLDSDLVDTNESASQICRERMVHVRY